MTKTLSQIGEFGLINRIQKQVGKSASVIRGIGDDAAVVPVLSGKNLLLTTDMLIEGTHFKRSMPATAIGHKAIAVNISDIAAMGGLAQYAVVSLGVPASCSWRYISGIYEGMKKTAKKHGIQIIGGDTVKNNKIVINVSMVGYAKKKELTYRNGAKKGDQIFVTGPLGKSLSSGWHLRFAPRIPQAQYLVHQTKPSAMIDISDGLAADLGHILKGSRVGAVLEERLIPRRGRARLNQALYDGEDFELLFTLSPAKARKLLSQKRNKLKFYRIGEIVDSRYGLQIKTAKGTKKKITTNGYTHF